MEREKITVALRRGSSSLAPILFSFPETPGSSLRLRRTTRRKIVSLRYGRFPAVERIGHSPAHPELPEVHSPKLAILVAKGANHAYDLIVRVGIAHYIECRQYAEIKDDLAAHHALETPVRTIGHLAKKFVAYVQVVHQESIPLLTRDMARRGGYILHIDGTCEEGSGVLLLLMDSLSGQVLASKRIKTENTEEIAAELRVARRDWGVPLCVVHDLGQCIFLAVDEVFPGVPQFVCHFHFVADVGKDILDKGVDRLRRLFRTSRVRQRLGSLERSLRKFAVDSDGSHVVQTALEGLPLVSEEEGRGIVQGLLTWILAFSRAGDGYGHPFDLRYLELYERIAAAKQALDAIRPRWSGNPEKVATVLAKVYGILETVTDGELAAQFDEIIEGIRRDRSIFEELRESLRICPKDGKKRRNDEGAPEVLSPLRHRAVLTSLKSRLEMRAKKDEGAARACRIMVQHIEKYMPYLTGHRVAETPHRIVAPRTNNIEEQMFRKIKRGCRRLHGRGRLCRDLHEMPATTILIENLKNPEYCRTVYGGMGEERIAARFSTVDPRAPKLVMESWDVDRRTSRLPRKIEKSSDLPSRLEPVLRAACRDLQTSL